MIENPLNCSFVENFTLDIYLKNFKLSSKEQQQIILELRDIRTDFKFYGDLISLINSEDPISSSVNHNLCTRMKNDDTFCKEL